MNIGLNYLQQKMPVKCIEHNKIAIKSFILNKDLNKQALCLKNIGDAYQEMNQMDSSISYYNKAYSIYSLLNDTVALTSQYLVLGNVYLKLNELDRSKQFLINALELWSDAGRKTTLAYIYKSLSELYLQLADFESDETKEMSIIVIYYGKKLEVLADQIGVMKLQRNAAKLLSKGYKNIGDYQKSLRYANLFISLNDSIYSTEKEKIIIENQIRYETEKKALEIQLLNSENELMMSELSHDKDIKQSQKIVIYLLGFGFLLVFIFSIIIFRFYRLTKKINFSLENKTNIIIKQKDEIELLLKELHHRVKNNLQIISGLIELQASNIENPECQTVLSDAQSRLKSIAVIHQVLYQNEQNENVNFKTFVEELCNQIEASFNLKNKVEIEVNIPNDLNFNSETILPLGLIVNELITNSFKYAFIKQNDCKISVELFKANVNSYNLCVGDNGIGLPLNYDLYKSKSLGLKLVQILAEQLSGDLKYNFKGGSKFSLLFLPIVKG